MTLLYIDGFGHGQLARYTTTQSLSFAQTTTPRITGCRYVNCSTASAGDVKRSVTASAEVFSGIGIRPQTLSTGVLAFWGDSGATQHISLFINSSGFLEARLGNYGGTVLATGTTLFSAGTWHYVEARVKVADSGGIVQVRLDGSTVNEIDFTGDTKNAGTSTNIDAVSFRTNVTGIGNYQADWYILNALGTVNNTWLGDVAVRILTPAGDGNYSQLVGSDGNSVSNYQQVDEIPPNSTDYNGSATIGNKDSYTVTSLPAGVSTVYGVQVGALMAKSDAGAASGKVLTRAAGTDYTPTTTTLTTSYVETIKLWETNPGTSALWSAAEVNALEVGMEVA